MDTDNIMKKNNAKRKVIIDCDTGVDDAQAILLALSTKDLDIVAITCVFGNVPVDQAARNTVRVLHAAGVKDIPVFLGCSKPLIDLPLVQTAHTDATKYHGTDGLGDSPEATIGEPNYSNIIKTEKAAVAICRLINENPGELTLIALGPLTNIAVAFKIDETVPSKLKETYIMGGAIHSKGNITVVGEFNTSTDPEATSIVLDSATCPTYLFPWETCCDGGLDWEWHAKWITHESAVMKFISLCSKHTCEMDRKVWHTPFCPPDLVTMAILIDKELITSSQICHCYVDTGANPLTRGQLIVDWRNLLQRRANMTIILKWSSEKFQKVLESMTANLSD